MGTCCPFDEVGNFVDFVDCFVVDSVVVEN